MRVYQDGGQFYAEGDAGGLLADYGDLVKHDYDMDGAGAARALFIQEHGDRYTLDSQPRKERHTYLVAVYDCEQRYGGREEGGWWYDAGTLVRIVRVFANQERAYSYARRLNGRLQSRAFGPNVGKHDYTSVCSEGELRAQVEVDTAAPFFPARRPTYE